MDASQVRIRFCSGDEKCPGLVQFEDLLKIKAGSVHQINRRKLRRHQVEHVDIVQFAVGNMYETRDMPAQVQ